MPSLMISVFPPRPTRKWSGMSNQQPGTIAVSVGTPVRSDQLAHLPREKALAELYHRVRGAKDRAELLRRKG